MTHTPGPWVQFADQGKCIAIMPAGREGDICTFNQSPSDADALLMSGAPDMLIALWNLCAFAERHGFDNEPEVQAARRAITRTIG